METYIMYMSSLSTQGTPGSFLVIRFLALLCATAQQSYCRHVGVSRLSSVRRPSVRQ